MTWVFLALVVAAAIIVARIFFKVRNIRASKQESWDAKIIEQLRSKGYAPFNEYDVDFFLALPDEPACQAVRRRARTGMGPARFSQSWRLSAGARPAIAQQVAHGLRSLQRKEPGRGRTDSQ